MRKILKRTLGRGSEDQKGFTLIELLVVVGIIVALAAVIVPLVIQFAGKGDEGAQAAELAAVQAAIDTMMTSELLVPIIAGASLALIDGTVDFDPDASATQYLTDYIRDTSTNYCYTWDDTGQLLTQGTWDSATSTCTLIT